MNPPGPIANSDTLLRRLVENTNESAAAALFMQLYRESPELRDWLRDDYARDAKLRATFDGLTMSDIPPQVARFADFADDKSFWRDELSQFKKQIPAQFYGGLTWKEVVQLVHHYQAGTLDPGVYLLVRQWRKAGKATPVLMWAGVALLESVLPSGKRRLLKHLNQALAFVKKYENKAERRTAVGYADWWKLNTLIYILWHPRESYSTRDLRAHLATLGLEIGTRDMRRFCKRHGIKRDIQAGRPRNRTAGSAGQTGQPIRKLSDRRAG